jgi:DNA-binding response OmpR family regulator
LVLSNDETILGKAQEDLTRLGYEVETGTVEPVQKNPGRFRADVILLDLTGHQQAGGGPLPILRDLSGLEDAPIVALLARSQLSGFDPGAAAEEFVLAPWAVEELHARIKQTLWRARKTEADDSLKVGDLVINPANFEVTLKGEPVDLTYKEYELLRFLSTHKERVHTRDTLLDQVWGYDYFGGTRTVDVHVRRLRAKIGDPDGVLIQTVRNVGYRLSERAP